MMKEVEFKRYNEQSCIWYYKYNPAMEAFPLAVDHNKFTSIGLSEKVIEPIQISYMGFTKIFPSKNILRNIQPEIVLKLGDTVECNGWKLKLNSQADLFQAVENLKTEYYCQ